MLVARMLARFFCAAPLLTLAALLCAPPRPVAAQTPTTLILVRHAEPQPDGTRDPGLGVEGRQRAERLLAAVREGGVRAVYTTQLRRARETGEVVAAALDVPLVVVEADAATIGQYPAALLERLRRERPGQTVLVVGHSNTIPPMVTGALGAPAPATPELPHDSLFVLTLGEGGASVLRARF